VSTSALGRQDGNGERLNITYLVWEENQKGGEVNLLALYFGIVSLCTCEYMGLEDSCITFMAGNDSPKFSLILFLDNKISGKAS
jgi:hypothetical protein